MADAADKAAQIANLLEGTGTASRAELRAIRLERKSKTKKAREIVTMTFSEFKEFIARCAPDPELFKLLWPVVSSLFLDGPRRFAQSIGPGRREDGEFHGPSSSSLPLSFRKQPTHFAGF